jgi:hypothetical protein
MLEAVSGLMSVATLAYKEAVNNGLPDELAATIVMEIVAAALKGTSPYE